MIDRPGALGYRIPRPRAGLAGTDLPMLHQDPFDRMQIVQANLEGLTLITRDSHISQYQMDWIEA